jgi:hypothetical protein
MTDSPLIPPALPPSRFYRVKVHPSCKWLGKAPRQIAHDLSLTLITIKLIYVAGDAEADDSGVRHLEFPQTVIAADGSELAAISVYYRMSADGEEAEIIAIEPVEPRKVVVSDVNLGDFVREYYLRVIARLS